jgi:hypothetical protein
LNVTLKVCVPLLKAALVGNVALVSVELIAIVSLAVVTRFQLASTPLTVTVQAMPAVCAVGLPVMPVALPGEAVSPGINSWSLVKAPGLTVNDGLLLAVTVVCVVSDAVTVQVPAVLLVRLKVLVPVTRAALAGRVALASLEEIATVSLVLNRFQLASTALTVAL